MQSQEIILSEKSQLFTSTLASFKLMLVIRKTEKKFCNMPTVSERWKVINHPGLNVAIDQKNYLIITAAEGLKMPFFPPS